MARKIKQSSRKVKPFSKKRMSHVTMWNDEMTDFNGKTGQTKKYKYVAGEYTPAKNPKRKSRGETPWIAHVKATQKKRGCTYGEAMKIAAKTYRK